MRPTIPTLKMLTCEWCGDRFMRLKAKNRYCSRECFARADGARRRALHERAWTSKDTRALRDSAAPGLSRKQRTKLLAKWKRRRALCAYCPELASTIDHVVPLVLGGTNVEGNLAPACRRCNSSKSSRLLVEWRGGRSAYAEAA